MNRPRVFLVTPPSLTADKFAPMLEAALSGGDVACVLIYQPDLDSKSLQTTAETLVPIIQKAGAAALVYNNTQVAGRSGADGAHVDTSLEDVKLAVESLQPAKIVGAGGTKLKHDDMEWAETGIDYLFFGRLDLDEKPEPHDKTLSKAQWWAELFETPCVALSGNDLDSVDLAAGTGADFVALKDAVWQYSDGPAAAVSRANEILEGHEFPDVE